MLRSFLGYQWIDSKIKYVEYFWEPIQRGSAFLLSIIATANNNTVISCYFDNYYVGIMQVGVWCVHGGPGLGDESMMSIQKYVPKDYVWRTDPQTAIGDPWIRTSSVFGCPLPPSREWEPKCLDRDDGEHNTTTSSSCWQPEQLYMYILQLVVLQDDELTTSIGALCVASLLACVDHWQDARQSCAPTPTD